MEITKYKVNEAEIAKMSSIYMDLTINGIDDEAGAAEVHSAKMIVVKHRTSIDKLRLSTNKNAQDFIKTNNKNAADLIDLLAPIERHLKAEENTISIEKERIQAEKKAAEQAIIQKRVDALLALNVVLPFFDMAMMSDEEYAIKYHHAQKDFDAAIAKAEEERIAKEAEEKRLEEVRKAQEAEAKRLADIHAANTKKEAELKEQQEAIAKEHAEKEAAIETARKAIEDEKLAIREAKAQAEREERERIDREAFEKQAKEEAEVQAKKDAVEAEKARKAKEKANVAEKARKAALAPDKEKLIDLAMTIMQIISPPAIQDEAAKEIVKGVLSELAAMSDNLISQAEEL